MFKLSYCQVTLGLTFFKLSLTLSSSVSLPIITLLVWGDSYLNVTFVAGAILFYLLYELSLEISLFAFPKIPELFSMKIHEGINILWLYAKFASLWWNSSKFRWTILAIYSINQVNSSLALVEATLLIIFRTWAIIKSSVGTGIWLGLLMDKFWDSHTLHCPLSVTP